MEGAINSVKQLFTAYGFRAGAIIVATVIIVNLLKKPILKKGEVLIKKLGGDKSVISKNFVYLPVGVAFILNFAVEVIACQFNFNMLDFESLCAAALLYGGLAVSVYETVKIQLKAYIAKKTSEPEK